MSDDLSIPSGPVYRVPRHRRGLDPAARRRVVIAAGLFGVLVLGGGVWSMLGHRQHGVPVVQADTSPLRVKPLNPGGLQVAAAGNEIFSGGSDTAVDKLAPPPETPNLQALRAPPPPAPAPKPAEAAAPTTAPPPAPPQPLPIAAAPRPAVAAATVPTPPKPTVAAGTLDHRVAPAALHGGKGALVQLAALSSEQAAKVEWDHLAKRMPDLLSGRQPALSKVEHDGRTYWRLRTGGFTDAAQATGFCERLRSKGATCRVADF